MITFKKYLLLTEWTRELMPEVYAALEKHDDPMVGVHFSKGVGDEKKKTPHLGLNLNPFHSDPIGIYAFPKEYALSGKLESNPSFREFTNFYIVKPSPRANILNLSTMTDGDAIDILKQMDIDEKEYHSEDIYHKSGRMSAGHRFWGTLEKMRKKIYGDYDKNLSWNKLFKKTPYNVLYDEGSAIIHPREPSQIVYLNSSAMEILDQGKQDDKKNKIYSFLIKSFPDLRPQKTTDHWTHRILKLRSNKGYDLIVLIRDREIGEYSKIEVSIKNQTSGKSEPLGEFLMGDDIENFVNEIKQKIASVENKYSPESEKEVPPVLEKISKRFNIKLKKEDNIGDWEIHQRYQDSDKDYVIHFYIRRFKNEMFFVLQKLIKNKGYQGTFGYGESIKFNYSDDESPDYIVNKGLNELKNRLSELYEDSPDFRYSDAMKTVEFLRNRVFGLS